MSIIEWLEPEILICLMEKQGEKLHRIDADKSEMVRRALPYIEHSLDL